ncbi:Plant invertase/pectin methylesterase inhibitor superfamily protein [Euphorbia peplus]|nr:Plant invertase/pectin methylesterase inhibitor superfamily protein [Euphorbia peplus]
MMIYTSFCSQYLKSIPHIAEIDLHGLCKIFLNTTHGRSLETYSVIKSLLNQTTDKHFKSIYESCLLDFDLAAHDLVNAFTSFRNSDFRRVVMYASNALIDGASCMDDSPGLPPLPVDPSLGKKIDEFKILCSMLANVARLLQ